MDVFVTGVSWGLALRSRWLGPALTAVAAAMLAPGSVLGQAVCSAPHSSPTLAQSGSIRTLPRGAGWVQLSLYGQRARDFFNPLGDRQKFLADSRFDTRSVFVTAAVGIMDGVEVWVQLPTHRLRVEASGGSSTSAGVGDVRAALRVGSERVGLTWPVALRVGAKVPGSDFPVDATVLPLTEGQTDFEASIESGRSLGDGPVYIMGWAGYRWRSENVSAARRPGDEGYAHVALGGMAGGLAWEIAADGLWGAAPLAQGLRLTGERRRLLQILPTVGYGVGAGRLEITGQLPVYGRNLPAGAGVSAGYRLAWGM